MQQLNEQANIALKRTVIVAIFAAVAVVLSLVESLIPLNMGVPGAKLGLANIMVLTCLYFLRARDALMMVLLKTLLTAFIFGTFSSFLFSIMGALFSFVAMWFLLWVGRDKLSFIGISIVGGIAHNIGQLTAACIYFNTSKIFYYLPMLLIMGVLTGIAVGIAVRYLVPSLSKLSLFENFLG
ncbi:Gx transporter family protein [Paenibacillus aceti]|uniref:Heptaprenyl diphosphate synthase subunit I n=1 Tax=Paenibacillus aceti TaxID=1820010 RepID=A0ABQ1VW37_9BACL|nr:Gx transporter family protein [Paenibacillus aceti]GGF99161.1 heptaprenyl diphosphate synthase subunit I [Paenibacillus aceti]